MTVIQSKDNLRVRRWRRLLADSGLRQSEGRALVEGSHLVNEALVRGVSLENLIVRQSAESDPAVAQIIRCAQLAQVALVVLADRVFDALSELDSAGSIAAEVRLPAGLADLQQASSCVFLERIQDPGNIGAIIRSAAALGVASVVTDAGCADPWSGKALRAGQGGHFCLDLRRSTDMGEDMNRFGGIVIGTVPAGGEAPAGIDLRGRVGWVFGSEGAGLSRELSARCSRLASIPMPGTTESLNVAAAAAICLYEAARQRSFAASGER